MNSKELVQNDITFTCEALTNLMEKFKDDFERNDDKDLFQIPDYLQPLVFFWFIHEITKTILCKNIPKETLLVDMIENPQKNIDLIDELIRYKTNGFLLGLDQTTKYQLKNPEFRYLLLGIFYMKASWDGEKAESLPFNNLNGEIKQNVPFFKLLHQKVIIVKNRIQVDVLYETNNSLDSGNFVRFTKPARYWERRFNAITTVYLPNLDVNGRQEKKWARGKIVINFKYKQDEKGFEAACLYAQDCIDGVIREKKKIYFDEPFQIEIYAKSQKVFQVNVNNI